MTHKVIIDADPGIGDALAIALALSDPRLDVLALTATAGVVSGEQATRNLQSILESLDPAKWPRLGCCSNPTPVSTYDSLGGNARPIDLHGARGLGENRISRQLSATSQEFCQIDDRSCARDAE